MKMTTPHPTWARTFLALTIAFFLTAHAQAETNKIGIIDMQKVWDKYHKTKQAQAQVDDQTADFEKRKKGMLDDYQKANDEYKKLLESANDQAASSDEREKRKSAYFDALPWRRIRRSRRIREGRVRRKPRPILVRIVNFENDRFVTAHLGKINPTMMRIVFKPISLADPVWVAAFRHHQIVKRNASSIGKRQRIGLDRPIDRSPYLNDREAAL